MAAVENDQPGDIVYIEARQLATWDIEAEHDDPDKPIFMQIFTCDVCAVVLPYPKAEHDCLEETETDEGFEEIEDYMDDFDAFTTMMMDNPRYIWVTPCLCGDLHLMDEISGNNFHDELQIIRVNRE